MEFGDDRIIQKILKGKIQIRLENDKPVYDDYEILIDSDNVIKLIKQKCSMSWEVNSVELIEHDSYTLRIGFSVACFDKAERAKFLQEYPNSDTLFAVSAFSKTNNHTLFWSPPPITSCTIFENAYFLRKCFHILYTKDPNIFSLDELDKEFEQIWSKINPEL